MIVDILLNCKDAFGSFRRNKVDAIVVDSVGAMEMSVSSDAGYYLGITMSRLVNLSLFVIKSEPIFVALQQRFQCRALAMDEKELELLEIV